jgi:zinc D-Ala-D-Ala carboxypeptidase
MNSSIVDRIPVCPHAPEDPIKPELLKVLSNLEEDIGEELEYNSGYRCEQCNREAKGAKNSAHLRGYAVDIKCNTSRLRYLILSAVAVIGVNRIGVGKTFIHIDVDPSLAEKVVWLYD